jgi:hypothetical protein
MRAEVSAATGGTIELSRGDRMCFVQRSANDVVQSASPHSRRLPFAVMATADARRAGRSVSLVGSMRVHRIDERRGFVASDAKSMRASFASNIVESLSDVFRCATPPRANNYQ